MQQLLEDTWSQIQGDLRARAGEAAYDAWLAELKPLTLERGICYVEARNLLTSERVQRMFAPLLEECLSEGFGTRLSVTLVAAPRELDPERLEVGPDRPVLDAGNRTAYLYLDALREGRKLPSTTCLLHGVPGTGKSYLLRWFAQRCKRRLEFPADRLIRAFQACLKDGRVLGLRTELATKRPLIVDEVHRVTGHERIQRELAAVIQDRTERGLVTVLASRHHPRAIWRCGERLVGVLLSGLVTKLELPGPAARLQYLRALEGAPSRNGRASDIDGLAREVRGSYVDLRRAWLAQREGVSVRGGYLKLIDPRTTFENVLARVAEQLSVEPDAVIGRSQERRVSFARQVVAYLCVQEGLSRAEVGRFLDGRSRAAISYATRALEKRMAESDEVRARVEAFS